MSIVHKKSIIWRAKQLAPKLIVALGLVLMFFVYDSLHNPPTYKNPTASLAPSADPFEVPTYDLFMNTEDYNFLFAYKPTSLTAYQPVEFYAKKTTTRQKGKVRVRGSHAWHWYPQKPSLRLRLRLNDQPFYLDFVSPEDPAALANPLAMALSKNLSLPTYQSNICLLNLNNKPLGLYNLQHTSASNLAMCQHHGATTLVSGNTWSLEIWRNPSLWQLTPISATYIADPEALETNINTARHVVTELLSLFSWPMNPNNAQGLKKHLDLEALARWSAFQTAIAGIHTDDFHNNFFLLNDQKKLVPIVTDPAAFGSITTIAGANVPTDHQIPIYEFLTPILDLALRDPEFQYKRNKYLYGLLKGPLAKEKVSSIIDNFLKILTPLYFREGPTSALVTVPILEVPMRLPVSVQQRIKDAHRIKEFYVNRANYVLEQLSNCEVEIEAINNEATHDFKKETSYFKITLNGNAPIKANLENLDISFSHEMSLDSELKPLKEALFLYPQLTEKRSKEANTKWLLLDEGRGRLAKYILESAPKSYYIGVRSSQKELFIEQLKNTCINAITHERVEISIP